MRFLLVLVAVLLVACGPSEPKFKSTDITGVEWGRELALTDHNGKARTLADFRGKVVAVFFGYVRCPDVCPTTLVELKLILEQLGEDAKRVQVLVVTLDPERDTQAMLAQYATAFDPSFLGLYGDSEATRKAAKEFKVFYQKAPGTKSDNYTVDHTAGTYVLDPNGRLRLFATYGRTAGLATDIRMLLNGA